MSRKPALRSWPLVVSASAIETDSGRSEARPSPAAPRRVGSTTFSATCSHGLSSLRLQTTTQVRRRRRRATFLRKRATGIVEDIVPKHEHVVEPDRRRSSLHVADLETGSRRWRGCTPRCAPARRSAARYSTPSANRPGPTGRRASSSCRRPRPTFGATITPAFSRMTRRPYLLDHSDRDEQRRGTSRQRRKNAVPRLLRLEVLRPNIVIGVSTTMAALTRVKLRCSEAWSRTT